jgi:hypothetical protein
MLVMVDGNDEAVVVPVNALVFGLEKYTLVAEG